MCSLYGTPVTPTDLRSRVILGPLPEDYLSSRKRILYETSLRLPANRRFCLSGGEYVDMMRRRSLIALPPIAHAFMYWG